MAIKAYDSHFVTLHALVRGEATSPLTPSFRRRKIKTAKHSASRFYFSSAHLFYLKDKIMRSLSAEKTLKTGSFYNRDYGNLEFK
ncbi:hypothetical protein [Lactococcus cremoris]|uniref:Uncharacterized protein n=1 Tax=Lactococcus lactis subsp. cremoris TaxID=1359 RepID=A0AA47KW91_LACLC|nr:hypothetical protein [Lactococcus cremoris]WHL74854.1 hypothetical protein LLJM3_04080 [Lactococcus cremoris]